MAMDGTVPYYFRPLYFVVKKPRVLHMFTEKLHLAWGKMSFQPPVICGWGLEK